MNLPDDIGWGINELFLGGDRDEAAFLLSGAKVHDGAAAGARLQRCALAASSGSLERLRYYVGLLAVDSRDVIVAGEYEFTGDELVRVRDLTRPF